MKDPVVIPLRKQPRVQPGQNATTSVPEWVSNTAPSLVAWRGRSIVVAVSGGSDSVGLLHVLETVAKPLALRLTVAHLNHGQRSVEAEHDAAFVADLSRSLGFEFRAGVWKSERKGHFEADARRARYAWLTEVARSIEAPVIAVGHTRDDQVETILLRILRGTGPRGLSGMPANRELAGGVTLIRPLLAISRVQIREYLASIGQSWREDQSNAALERTRNRVRHDLLPKLRNEYNPEVAEALLRLSRLVRGEHRSIERAAARFVNRHVERSGDASLAFSADAIGRLSRAMRLEVLRVAWRSMSWPEGAMSERTWRRLDRVIKQRATRASLPSGVRVEVSKGSVRLCRATTPGEESPTAPAVLPIPGQVAWGSGTLVAEFADSITSDYEEMIDFDALDLAESERGPSLIVRTPDPGDRFDPLGLDGHTQRVSEFLRGRGVPRSERCRVPLVCDRAGIVWVAGHRIAHRARLTETTRRRLGLSWDSSA